MEKVLLVSFVLIIDGVMEIDRNNCPERIESCGLWQCRRGPGTARTEQALPIVSGSLRDLAYKTTVATLTTTGRPPVVQYGLPTMDL